MYEGDVSVGYPEENGSNERMIVGLVLCIEVLGGGDGLVSVDVVAVVTCCDLATSVSYDVKGEGGTRTLETKTVWLNAEGGNKVMGE